MPWLQVGRVGREGGRDHASHVIEIAQGAFQMPIGNKLRPGRETLTADGDGDVPIRLQVQLLAGQVGLALSAEELAQSAPPPALAMVVIRAEERGAVWGIRAPSQFVIHGVHGISKGADEPQVPNHEAAELTREVAVNNVCVVCDIGSFVISGHEHDGVIFEDDIA